MRISPYLPITPHISPYLLVGLDADSLPTSLPISPHISSMLVGVQVSRHISPHLPASPHISPRLEYDCRGAELVGDARPVAKPGMETRRDGWPTGGRWELKPAPGAVCFLGPPVPKVGAGYFEATLTGHGRRPARECRIRHLSALRPQPGRRQLALRTLAPIPPTLLLVRPT